MIANDSHQMEQRCLDSDLLRRVATSEATMPVERALHARFLRLPGIVVAPLAVACVIGAVLAGCASPAPTDSRDTIVALSPADVSKAVKPRFAQGGPDAEDYGANRGYPIGDRATCLRGSDNLAFFVGCHSHFDQVYEGRLLRQCHDAFATCARGFGTGGSLRI